MNRLLVLALVSCCNLSAFGQQFTQTIKGRLVDQQSGSPIIGATVLVKDIDPLKGSTTDFDGYYRIANVPIGRRTLFFSSIGYESKTLPNINVTSGKEVVINTELIESLIQIDEVVITADKQDKGQPENDMATVSAISLTVEETSRYAATFGDPARAALSQPGVTTGGDDLLNEIVIRGNSPKGILWRLEGVEIPNPNHFANVGSSAGGISMLSSSVLSNSDFFTAAFPAQYGNASSGIFDLKMRNGNFDKREHSFQAGLLGIQASSEGPFNEKSNASYLFNYRYSTLGLITKMGLDILGDEEFVTFQDLSFKINLPTKKLGKFSIWGLGGVNTYESSFFDSYNFRNDSAFAAYYIPRFGPNEDSVAVWKTHEDIVQHMGATGLTHVAYLNRDTYLESVFSVTSQRYRYRWDSMKLRELERETMLENTIRFSTLINHKFDARNTLRVGGIASRMSYDLFSDEWDARKEEYRVYLDEDGATYYYQSFAQWQHRINQKLTINTGIHASYFELNKDFYVEPRFGFRYQHSIKTAFTGGVGLHSRMETISLYMAQQLQANGSYVQQNKNLGFTKAAHAVLGFENMIRPDMRFKAEAYYQYLYDVPVWPVDSGDFYLRTFSLINQYDGFGTGRLTNSGTGENYGIEVTLEKFFTSDHYFMVNGSLYSSSYKGIDDVRRSTVFDGNYIFNALGGREFVFKEGKRVLDLNARFIYAGGKREAPIVLQSSQQAGFTVRDYSENNEMKLDDYWRVDFGVNYKINKPKTASVFSLNVQNLFAVSNEYGRYYADGRIYSASQLGFFPNLSYRIEF